MHARVVHFRFRDVLPAPRCGRLQHLCSILECRQAFCLRRLVGFFDLKERLVVCCELVRNRFAIAAVRQLFPLRVPLLWIGRI